MAAVAGDLDVAPVPGEVVEGANLTGAHPALVEQTEDTGQGRDGSSRHGTW